MPSWIELSPRDLGGRGGGGFVFEVLQRSADRALVGRCFETRTPEEGLIRSRDKFLQYPHPKTWIIGMAHVVKRVSWRLLLVKTDMSQSPDPQPSGLKICRCGPRETATYFRRSEPVHDSQTFSGGAAIAIHPTVNGWTQRPGPHASDGPPLLRRQPRRPRVRLQVRSKGRAVRKLGSGVRSCSTIPTPLAPVDPGLLVGATHEFVQPDWTIMSLLPNNPPYASQTII